MVRGQMKRFLKVFFVLAAVLVLAAAGGLWWINGEATRAVGPPDAPEQEFAVPKGTTGRALGQALVSKGLVRSPLAWRWFLFRRGALNPKFGRHLVSAKQTP